MMLLIFGPMMTILGIILALLLIYFPLKFLICRSIKKEEEKYGYKINW